VRNDRIQRGERIELLVDKTDNLSQSVSVIIIILLFLYNLLSPIL